MRDRIVHGVIAAALGCQPLLLALGVEPELSAAIVAMIGAFYSGYRMNNAEAQGAVKLRRDLIDALRAKAPVADVEADSPVA